MRENTEGYIRSFRAFTGARYNGSLIVRLQYKRVIKLTVNSKFTAQVVKDRSHFQILSVIGWGASGQRAGQMKLTIWFPDKNCLKTQPDLASQPAELTPDTGLWRSFTAEEVQEFSKRTGDHNTIHQSKRPVVQGLLLWQQLFEWLGEPECLECAFHAPVYSNDPVYVQEKEGQGNLCCRAFSKDGRLFFSAVAANILRK